MPKRKLAFPILISLLLLKITLNGQTPGFYNNTEGKKGEELKSALHEIINDHVDFSYSDAKYIINYADEDPDNTNNVILFYTKRSQDKDTYGNGSNDINREHVWAKSHGDYSGIRPMDGDAYNLHPTDASVNMARLNYDFDECSATGTYINEADAYYTNSQFEPSDAAKGEVARTIFYMAVRYEGTANEIDLEVVDKLNTSPAPEHGKLSTLLQWNRDFPPNFLERRRNERVYESQRNRNPFIDNPEFADLIWGNALPATVSVGDVNMAPEFPLSGESALISSEIITSNTTITYAKLSYGSSYNSEDNTVVMDQSDTKFSGNIDFTGFSPGSFVYFKIETSDGVDTTELHGNYLVPKDVSLIPISDVQGTGSITPLNGSIVTIGGIVTANFDNTVYIQSGTEPRSGIAVFDNFRGRIGDSVVYTGKAVEYNTLTELAEISYSYNYGAADSVKPVELKINEITEDYEGMFVEIKNVTFYNGDQIIPLNQGVELEFTDGTNSMIVYSRYNSRISGKRLPGGTVNVKGVVSQYQGDYQLLVNNINDISLPDKDSDAPIISDVVVNDASWIEVRFNERIDKTTAETISNYSITGDVSISGAFIYNDTKVLLLTSGLEIGNYTITINGVEDLHGNAISDASFDFYSEYTTVKITDNPMNGSPVLYPNPASDRIIIRQNGFNARSVTIYDTEGRQIKVRKINSENDNIKISLEDTEPGVYYYEIKSGKTSKTGKFVKK